MTDPAQYDVLMRNIFRLVEDAELLLDAGRYASANALAIFALEEAGKYTAFMSETQPPKKAKLHVFRQETIGEYFRSAAFFEAVARELDPMLESLKEKSPESYAEAMAMPRRDLLRLTMDSILTDPEFDMDKFMRRVIGIDPSMTFGAEAKAGEYHRERQESVHADYDENGNVTSNPFDITEEKAIRSVEMARWGAQLQKFWLSSWEKHRDDPT